MNLRRLQRHWDHLGKRDPLWAIITLPDKRGGKWDPEELFRWGREEIQGLLSHLDGLGHAVLRQRALDFGCGVGRLTQALADHFDEVHGVDIAPSMIRQAEAFNRHGPRCRYHLLATGDLGLFEPQSFDLVSSSLTLQHMEPTYAKRYLVEFLRVMRSGAVLAFQLPSVPEPVATTLAVHRSRRLLKRLVPRPVRRWIHQLRGWRPLQPRMEMHGIPAPEVIELLQAHGGVVLDVQPDAWATGWKGFRYYVTKPSSVD